ncbi:MAG: hypothetical protein DUD26_06775 [Eubacteriaceae bacterium]|nr:MAG: hypothetical protein DUD26_06775 [Eubacteriaceae bacterium]
MLIIYLDYQMIQRVSAENRLGSANRFRERRKANSMEIQKTHELSKRILFTIFVLVVYLTGKNILLYGVSAGGGRLIGVTVQSSLTMMFSGDRYQRTIMALGIMPYINASLLVQVISALKSANSRAKISKQKQDRWMFIAALAITVLMAVVQSADLTFRASAGPLFWVRLIVILEMIGGAMLTYALCTANEKRGIGAPMPIILLNVLTTLIENLSVHHYTHYPVLIAISAVVVAGTAFLENSIIKVPLQRVSIHNIHADQNYMAYKRNPVGIMPVMFATAAFIVPRYAVRLLAYLFPESQSLAEIRQNMVMTRPLGIGVYLVIIFVLTIGFSFIMLNPKESARQLQKNGDSIVGIYAGKKTTRYLVGLVLKWSVISGCLQAGCMAVSLILSLQGAIPTALAMIPSSAMILVSIVCSLVQEIGTYHRYDAYHFFM